MTTHDIQYMVDIETMATSPNAVICSIGATKFTFEDGIIDEFYCTVDAADCRKYGLVVEESTVNWWKQRPKHVLKALTTNTIPLRDALANFAVWYGPKSYPTWACGASFDPVIMQWAYNAVGLVRPWKFWDDRCYRTVRQLFKHITEEKFAGDAHNSLDDARHQTNHLIKLFNT